MTSSSTGSVNLDKFFEDVESFEEELREEENIHHHLMDSHEQSKTLHNFKSIKALRSKMDFDATLTLKKVKLIKVRLEALGRSNDANHKKIKLIKVHLEALDRSNNANSSLPNCGHGSSLDE